MSKRLIRVFQADLVGRSAELIGQEINVILKSNQTFFGRCWKVENSIIFLKDQRKHNHTLAFTQIESVIYDQSAKF
ncbi:MAG: hypothetical protein R2822_14900 [Spirosomataceae bacterium]